MSRCLLLVLCALLGASALPSARADDEAARLRAWYERLEERLTELDRKAARLAGAPGSPLAVADDSVKTLAAALLDLTNRLQELERRLGALEEAAKTAPADGAKGTDGKAAEAKAAEAKAGAPGAPDAAKGAGAEPLAADPAEPARPAFLADPQVVRRIPAPRRGSQVRFERVAGVRRATLDLPKGTAKSIYGELGCSPGAALYLVEGAPVLGITLVLVNDRRFLLEGEEFAFVRTAGRSTMARMTWTGDLEVTEHGPRYIETATFGIGLLDFLSLLERGGTVTIAAVTFEFVDACRPQLEDLCSVLHPERIGLLLSEVR
jgi:hypothetical protein